MKMSYKMEYRVKMLKRRLRVPFEWFGILLGVVTLSSLPHRMMMAVCDFASAVMYLFDGRGKRLALANLRVILKGAEYEPKAEYKPTAAERIIIRRSYRNMARTIGHAFWTCRNARRRVESVGEMCEEGKAFLATHKPAVTVSAHLGCWEILSQLAFLEGHQMMSVAKDIGTDGITALLMRSRRSIGQEIVHADGAFRPLLQGLKKGKSLGLLVDQVVTEKNGGIWVRYFGRPVPVSAAPAFFSAKCKAPIVVAWSRPLKDGHYRCEVISKYEEVDSDVWRMTQRCISDLEAVIRRHPSCWVLNYRYFREVPSEEALAQLKEREDSAHEGRDN